MKRTTFIILGIGIIILLFSFWVYSLLYGTPKSIGEVFPDFALFGGSNTDQMPIEETPVVTEQPVVDVIEARLRQLTMRPVIGYTEVYSTSTEPRSVLYAEAGTGHIFQIDMDSGVETRLSNITVPTASEAVFDPDGQFAAIRSGYAAQNSIILIDLRDQTQPASDDLAYDIKDMTFLSSGELAFTEDGAYGTVGKAIDPISRTERELFSAPFFAATMIWNSRPDSSIYIYPKASSRLNGYLYEIRNSGLVRLPIDGAGLTALGNRDYISFNKLVDRNQEPFVYSALNGTVDSSPIMTLPEKCDFSTLDPSMMYCGHELTEYPYTFPDDWYKGLRSFNDYIWKINLEFQSASQLINPLQSAGREIDIITLKVGAGDKMLYFINKHDKTLWVYEI